jgi:pantoate--beta-alanine ligase
MILFKRYLDLKIHLARQKESGHSIGFVPTMGALHEGHISLIEESRKINEITVCSIFVNPTQFNNRTDFEKYPETIKEDILALETASCDVLYLPSVDEIYPDGLENLARFDLGILESVFEGKYRPGHFQGVCNVVDRLLSHVEPNNLYMGQKDFQQCMVIQRLLGITGRIERTRLIVCPTLREADGLAMSSRNLRLTDEERKKAGTINRELKKIAEKIKPGSLSPLTSTAKLNLEEQGFKVDYVEIATSYDLQLLEQWDGKTEIVILAAAFLNEIRLIDNMVVNVQA